MTSSPSSSHAPGGILSLAQLFSTCVECFNLIHPSNDWDPSQKVLLVKLGIQQAHLLAWADTLNLTHADSTRDPRLDNPPTRQTIESTLRTLIKSIITTDRTHQLQTHGLKPPKKLSSAFYPSLDTARLESFRERLEALLAQRWETNRGLDVTPVHWAITDVTRFPTFLSFIRAQVDSLITLTGSSPAIHRALTHDIKALAWHPVFERRKASSDMAKLRLIKQACAEDYPDYASAADAALRYLDQEWKDSYAERQAEIKRKASAAAALDPPSEGMRAAYAPAKIKVPSLLGYFRRKSAPGKRPPQRTTSDVTPVAAAVAVEPPLGAAAGAGGPVQAVPVVPVVPVADGEVRDADFVAVVAGGRQNAARNSI
ncbi:hypothetical protein EJ06DRAFT_532511 [Trichodelitschia bisporula]|uniref:Prion-inhibition and propagation HeLo domain-containing protein n=1 Tax=Trichodelitschia bisporula TaxID=703511 RepID=A0A6G1HQE9_9PEZI|nr:hypothetical protein EJ06DRAFT_532511 [Trichodelitschia bisporula]